MHPTTCSQHHRSSPRLPWDIVPQGAALRGHTAPWIPFPGKRGRKRATFPQAGASVPAGASAGHESSRRRAGIQAPAAPGASPGSRSVAPGFAPAAPTTGPACPSANVTHLPRSANEPALQSSSPR